MVKITLFIVCSCFILFKVRPQSACPFIMSPSRVVVRYEDSLSVNCSSTTDQRADMGWESTLGGVPLTAEDVVKLTIAKVDQWDLTSSCYIIYKNGTDCMDNLPITVYKTPDNVSISLPNQTQPLQENTEYQLQCVVFNVAPVKKLIVKWYEDNDEIYAEGVGTGGNKPQTIPYVLKRKALKDQNQVKIRCEAKFDFGLTGPIVPPISSPSLALQVLYKPFFEEPEVEMMEIPRDGKLSLDCTTKGNPTPEYHWQAPQPTQQKVGPEAVLDLLRPFPGTYNCTASNSQGSSVKRFILTDSPRDYSVLAPAVGVPAALGALLLISGLFIVTKDGTFSLNKGGYSSGQPTSKPV